MNTVIILEKLTRLEPLEQLGKQYQQRFGKALSYSQFLVLREVSRFRVPTLNEIRSRSMRPNTDNPVCVHRTSYGRIAISKWKSCFAMCISRLIGMTLWSLSLSFPAPVPIR